jgi:hypothetical protein
MLRHYQPPGTGYVLQGKSTPEGDIKSVKRRVESVKISSMFPQEYLQFVAVDRKFKRSFTTAATRQTQRGWSGKAVRLAQIPLTRPTWREKSLILPSQ